MLLLVGDNPFHGISHLSQARARSRDHRLFHSDYAAGLVALAMNNGADGFMFSVSEKTLSIIRILRQKETNTNQRLYAIIPYAYEYVRLATQTGISGLAKIVAKQMILSANIRATVMGIKGFLTSDVATLLKTYLVFEISRIKSAAGDQAKLDSVLLHEIVTEMALALNLDWLFKSYIEFMLKSGLTPGFETRNFAYLKQKFRDWGIDFRQVIIATPFNKIGFQMNPSKIDCENALIDIYEPNVIAMSIFAAGYIKPIEAITYIKNLPNLKGIVVGVSKEHHACETFSLLHENIG